MAELGSHQLDAAGHLHQRPAQRRRKGAAADRLGRRRPLALPARPRLRRPRLLHLRVPRPRLRERPEQEDRRHLLVDQRQRLRRLRRNRDGHQGHADPGARAGSDAVQQQRADHDQRHGLARARAAPTLDTTQSGGGEAAAVGKKALDGPVSRGYTEEIEHWAWCIRNPDPEQPAPLPARRWPWATP